MGGSAACRGCRGALAVPTLPLGDLAVAMRGERRALPWGEFLGVFFRPAARRSRLFPSFFGVLRMLNAIDWRLSACGGRCRTVRSGQGRTRGGPNPSFSSPLTCLLGGCCSLLRLSWELRRSLRSRGVWGRGKQLVGFLDWKRGDKAGTVIWGTVALGPPSRDAGGKEGNRGGCGEGSGAWGVVGGRQKVQPFAP